MARFVTKFPTERPTCEVLGPDLPYRWNNAERVRLGHHDVVGLTESRANGSDHAGERPLCTLFWVTITGCRLLRFTSRLERFLRDDHGTSAALSFRRSASNDRLPEDSPSRVVD